MMGASIHALSNDTESLQAIAQLAERVWRQHFTPIIGVEQVEYMLDKFQSAEAMRQQIEQGVDYFVLQNEQPIGYMALIAQDDKVMLSKLYLDSDYRGQGSGLLLLQYAENYCLDKGCQTLWLTVNRDNHDTIEWYLRQGFVIVDEVKKDIGNGFFMDDFIMQKIAQRL